MLTYMFTDLKVEEVLPDIGGDAPSFWDIGESYARWDGLPRRDISNARESSWKIVNSVQTMPKIDRYYKRKTDRGKWSAQDMTEAIRKIRNNELSVRQAAEQYNVPKSTLQRRVTNKNKIVTESEKYLGRFRQVFSVEQENEIMEYILEMEKRFFGITYKDLRQLAFDFAQANNIPNNFNKDSKMASKKWIYGFLHRHKNISLRKPEATSYARATGFNRAVGEAFGKASNVQTAVNGFRKTGIWPFNSEIFQEWEFAPSRTTERGENSENVDPAGETEVPAILPLNIKPTATRTTPLRSTTPTSTPSTSREQNSCSSSVQEIREKNDSDEDQPLSTYVAKRKLEIISEIPFLWQRKNRKKTSSRKSLKSTILTESPYKNKLEDLEASKSPKNAKGVKRAIVVEGKSKQEIQSSKKTNIIDHGTGASELDDTNCIVCGESYMDTKEDWYNCHGCSEWAHESCGTMDELETGDVKDLPKSGRPKITQHKKIDIVLSMEENAQSTSTLVASENEMSPQSIRIEERWERLETIEYLEKYIIDQRFKQTCV
ncbi:hypothetical protein NQ318_020545 [Aromia moschata]|uniref:HTH CENPB-type domain-containing protein n=1 Tax=Aromia moschata TaxID=1265417 RepID=A0AAV8Z0J0_9CUCU|nr:hypothetical protein NQ318_020545 [Aromia moschata]